MERRLAAVLAADVAGYSRLMGADEEGTLARLKAVRKTLVDPTIATHRGRIVKTTGDGMLVEFASAVDAARSAVEVQLNMAGQNAGVPKETRIEFRIGIHVGDIIFDDNDIFGDGVNIAARLEGIAEPGGVCISDDAHRHIRGKVDIVFDDMGPQALKNITEPMRAWRCQINARANASSAAPTKSSVETVQPLAITDKPSIAVLPFTCFSEEREFQFLTEAMSEDLITMLARIPGFIVIARQSAFAYQGRSVDSRQIGRELGVRYIIEGSLRPVGQQLRVGTQLIDATTGAQLWADRFDGQAEDVLELQDQIVRAIASRIEPELVRAEVALIRRRRDANPNAWSCFRQGAGLISLKGWSEETLTQATALLRQATTLDPDFALAHAQLALFLSLGARLGLVADGAAAVTEARTEAERAVAIDQTLPRSWAMPAVPWRSSAMCKGAPRYWNERSRTIRAMHRHGSRWGLRSAFLRRWMLRDWRNCGTGCGSAHAIIGWILGNFLCAGFGEASSANRGSRGSPGSLPSGSPVLCRSYRSGAHAADLGNKEEAVVALREVGRLRPRLSLKEIQLLVGRRATLLAPLWSEVSTSSY